MAAGFTKKKIKLNKTLGGLLKNQRKRKKISLEKAEEDTKIRMNFLIALEEDSWDKLPSDAYCRGYIECYSSYLSLKKADLLERYDKERHFFKKSFQEVGALSPKKSLTTMWLITPRMVAVGIGLVFIIFFSTYISFQVKSFAAAPTLVILSPKDKNVKIKNNDTVFLVGQTSPNTQVVINGQKVEVDNNGKFNQSLALTKGENTFVIKATNRNNKSRAELITVKSEL